MVLGYTHGEIALTVFVFVLIYGAGLMPRMATRLGRAMDRQNDKP